MSVTFPEAFLWGAAAAAHQIEGGNWNNDWWAFEHQPGTPCIEPSGDCCDSYHRYAEDIALVRELGLAAYRFSIEWSRIEPEDGEFSRAALDYYRRVLAECHQQGVKPVVTFHHFSTPRWMAALGGWESSEIVDRFARFCEHAVAHLGDAAHLLGGQGGSEALEPPADGLGDRTGIEVERDVGHYSDSFRTSRR